MTDQIAAFSGGKDSTALVLLLHEAGEPFDLLFTPTGNELPSLAAHIAKVAAYVDRPLVVPPNRSLADWIDHYDALPNNRQRWCTRLIKIVPCIAWLRAHPGTTLCVGLRADEPERAGLYGEFASYRYPLREAGIDLAGAYAVCDRHGMRPPDRTDCAVCPFQRLGEWYRLWQEQPAAWMEGEAMEARTGHTFRSASRDTWPAALRDLRARFEAGDVPAISLSRMQRESACRVCAL